MSRKVLGWLVSGGLATLLGIAYVGGKWVAHADDEHKEARQTAERVNALVAKEARREQLKELCAKGYVKVERCPANFEHPERER